MENFFTPMKFILSLPYFSAHLFFFCLPTPTTQPVANSYMFSIFELLDGVW